MKLVNSGKARAHTNIALIKYWGKADETYIIPMNNSLKRKLRLMKAIRKIHLF